MTREHPAPGGGDPRREQLIHDLLDGALAHEASRRAYEQLRGDAAACEDLARIRYAVTRLSSPIAAPDLSQTILRQVDTRRRFLSRRNRGLVTAGRLGVAAGVVAAVGLASFVKRSLPELQLAESAAPVSRVVETAEGAAREQTRLLESTVETIRSTLASPVARLSLSPEYRPEDGVRFDVTLPATSAEARITAAAPLAPARLGHTPAAAPALAAAPAAAGAPHPFINRFGPLLVILREPSPPVVDERDLIHDR
ncbi:MAG TPA: hypothetical protein VFF69_02035 [Phycisphaerales bacterium]|nr:hypothetical protein [Phycisphaerales bacterium]